MNLIKILAGWLIAVLLFSVNFVAWSNISELLTTRSDTGNIIGVVTLVFVATVDIIVLVMIGNWIKKRRE